MVWKEGMVFEGQAGDHIVPMDAKPPFGKDQAPTPKELVALGLGGCTAMDVIALLKKYKMPPKSLRVDVDVQMSTGVQPAIFEKALIDFIVEGDVDPAKLIEAVSLSQTKFCGVSAMLSKAHPIDYRITLNGNEIGNGSARF
jgi:putative redox protein